MSKRRTRLAQARRGAGLTQDQMAYRLGVDVSTVKRWETGSTAPLPWIRPKIAQLLDLSRSELADILAPATSQRFATAVPGPDPVAADIDWEELTTLRCRPTRLTDSAVTNLEQITDQQRRLYHELSSAEMLTQVQAHFVLLSTLLARQHPTSIRRRVATAAGEAAGFAAWLWFDLGDAARVQRCYDQARDAVEEAGDLALGAYVSGYRAMVATHSGDRGTALSLLNEAVERAPSDLSGRTRSWLEIQRAQALAAVGSRAEAGAAIEHAHDLHSHATPVGAEPWMYDFDEGSLAAQTGHCHLVLNQPQLAARAFERALHSQPGSCDRRGAKAKLGLAHARLAGGDGDEALRLATEALTVFAHRGSVLGLREVRRLRAEFAHHGLHSAVRTLDTQQQALHQPQ